MPYRDCPNTVSRLPNQRYRIPRTWAYGHVVKHRLGQELKTVEVCKTHGSWPHIITDGLQQPQHTSRRTIQWHREHTDYGNRFDRANLD